MRDELLSEKKGAVQDRRAGLTAVLYQARGTEKRLIAAQIGEEKIDGRC